MENYKSYKRKHRWTILKWRAMGWFLMLVLLRIRPLYGIAVILTYLLLMNWFEKRRIRQYSILCSEFYGDLLGIDLSNARYLKQRSDYEHGSLYKDWQCTEYEPDTDRDGFLREHIIWKPGWRPLPLSDFMENFLETYGKPSVFSIKGIEDGY